MPTYQHETTDRFMSLLGFVASGDLGPLTCYRSKTGRIVQFAKTWPKHTPTLAQLTGRARMSFGAEQWRHFTPYQKLAWKTAARTANLCMTGYGLWIGWWFRPDYARYYAIERQTRGWFLRHITRSDPATPPKPNTEPRVVETPNPVGFIRFSRDRIVCPVDVIERTHFYVYDSEQPDDKPFLTVLILVGPGYIEWDKAYNKRWFRVWFHSPPAAAHSRIHAIAFFPDSDPDVSVTHIETRPYL